MSNTSNTSNTTIITISEILIIILLWVMLFLSLNISFQKRSNTEKILENQGIIMQQLDELLDDLSENIDDEEEQDFTLPYMFNDENDLSWFTPQHEALLHAISVVESNGNPDAVGDNGNALGEFQIWKPCWSDAVEHDPSIGGSYTDVRNSAYARKIVLAYWDRYGYNVNYDIESLARIWNGGPRGYKKEATEKYWVKVYNVMHGKS